MRTLTINGNETVATYYATLMHADIQPSEIIITDAWMKNALDPVKLDTEYRYLKIKLNFWVESTTPNLYISNLLMAISSSVLKFSDNTHYYAATIVGSTTTMVTAKTYKLDVELKAPYGYISKATYDGLAPTSKTITVGGQLPTACKIRLDDVLETSVTVTIGALNYAITNITPGLSITIDGELKKILMGTSNHFAYTTMTAFPSFIVGDNVITVSTANYEQLNVWYKERYLL